MTKSPLQSTLAELTDIQREAVGWDDGSLLVLAGPGSGKTRVLTCRIARLLNSSPDQHFRILALTFTNKAANEMTNRVSILVPGLEGRANIGTFHSFCAEALRLHGAHLGIKPNFAIFSQDADRRAVLEDALNREARAASYEDLRLLPVIDHLKARLVEPEQVEQRVDATIGDLYRVARAYRLYEKELRRVNALDFNSLILEAYRLFAYPAMVRHYQTVYPHLLIDEFQDTNSAQYKLLCRLAGQGFRKIFAVADDDQTIFEWNGASVHRIRDLVKDFSCAVVQLPTNFRCPPRIVEAANRLVVYNARRTRTKQPAMAAPGTSSFPYGEQIQLRTFCTDELEFAGIAEEIACFGSAARAKTAVLARTRKLLEQMKQALSDCGVPAVIAARRDDFASPQMRWLVACLKQINRPLDRRNMAVLVKEFKEFAFLGADFDAAVDLNAVVDLDAVASKSESEGVPCLTVWIEAVQKAKVSLAVAGMVDVIAELASKTVKLRNAIQQVLECLEGDDRNGDLKDDLSAWRRIEREIGGSQEVESLDRFLQELQLRSKEPVPEAGAVSLATIHGAKGREFDTVYLIGLAEEVLPSWHSLQQGGERAALEEERRGCFVAVTRTRERLILSRARSYGGWPKKPSRFLQEMKPPG